MFRTRLPTVTLLLRGQNINCYSRFSCCTFMTGCGKKGNIKNDRIGNIKSGKTIWSSPMVEANKPAISESPPAYDFETFARIFRRSKFVQLGDFKDRIVFGTIVHRVANDLYIDIGLKFNAVCRAPSVNSEKYKIGEKVIMRLINPELSERFLGAKKDLTLLEADATLLGLYDKKPVLRT